MKTTRIVLALATGFGTSFCSFRLLDSGLIRIAAYATHTSYADSFDCELGEAKEVWEMNTARGFAVEAG